MTGFLNEYNFFRILSAGLCSNIIVPIDAENRFKGQSKAFFACPGRAQH